MTTEHWFLRLLTAVNRLVDGRQQACLRPSTGLSTAVNFVADGRKHTQKNANSCLRVISYFRLANYFGPMEADKTTHVFKDNRLKKSIAQLEMPRPLAKIAFQNGYSIRTLAFRRKYHTFANEQEPKI